LSAVRAVNGGFVVAVCAKRFGFERVWVFDRDGGVRFGGCDFDGFGIGAL
jgi:hypothetical protein